MSTLPCPRCGCDDHYQKWEPTPANINALPPGLREYVHGLETNCDPQYLVQQVTFLTDQCNMLQRALVLVRKLP